MKKQIISEEFKRMQKLAGITTEGKSFTPQDKTNFKWKPQPANPESMLTDTESGEEFSKGEYWKSDIIGTDPSNVYPAYGNENPDGTWTLTFDEGEFSGFVEGEDFTLGFENMQESEGVLKLNEGYLDKLNTNKIQSEIPSKKSIEIGYITEYPEITVFYIDAEYSESGKFILNMAHQPIDSYIDKLNEELEKDNLKLSLKEYSIGEDSPIKVGSVSIQSSN
jgi:hypothetical protein